MNVQQTKKFKDYATPNKESIRNLLKPGQGRTIDEKEFNYREIVDIFRHLALHTMSNIPTQVNEAAGILTTLLGRAVEVQEPPRDNGASRKLETLQRDTSEVQAIINLIDVRLDIDQNKHQHPKVKIGTRDKGGGNRFVEDCDAAWHIATTLQHMSEWATGLGPMNEGDERQHGQFIPVDGIHYEGHCLMAGGKKYVLFHCYPSNHSDLKL